MRPLSNIRTGVQYLGPLLALTYLALVTSPRPSCCGQDERVTIANWLLRSGRLIGAYAW